SASRRLSKGCPPLAPGSMFETFCDEPMVTDAVVEALIPPDAVGLVNDCRQAHYLWTNRRLC
ncbi:MAG: hypothetical protein AB2823_01710, partial [Candidatus Thiodiazotropha endolucinida]